MGMHADLLEACTRLADALQGWYGLVAGGCALVGFGMAGCSLLALRRHAEERAAFGGSSFWQGTTHILGGVLCINIETFMRALGGTLGGPMAGLVETLLGKG